MDEISVLLVEDNPGDAYLIKEYLIDRNIKSYSVTDVDTLGGALDVLVRENIDIVLLDLSLPDSSGLDTVRTVVTSFPQIVIVVLTGLQDEQVALQAVRYGAQDYLDKGQLNSDLLHRSISYSMERKKAVREKENLLSDLSKALERLEVLQKILPICVSCKKIRDENNKWYQIEDYIDLRQSREKTDFKICPECLNELYNGK